MHGSVGLKMAEDFILSGGFFLVCLLPPALCQFEQQFGHLGETVRL